MPTLAVIIAILAALVDFIDFLVSEPGDKRLKQALVDFYVAMEAGDWSALYRYPAKALLNFMQRWFGTRRFAIRYFLMTFIVSTRSHYPSFSALHVTVIPVCLNERNNMRGSGICALSTNSSLYGSFSILYLFTNIIFVYISWSLTQQAFKTLAESKG
jgi:hypothetical protein